MTTEQPDHNGETNEMVTEADTTLVKGEIDVSGENLDIILDRVKELVSKRDKLNEAISAHKKSRATHDRENVKWQNIP